MITRQEFPYLQELLINDAYAVKNLRVPVFEPGQEFKHLVLTGRNGSGKTTVLKSLISMVGYYGSTYDPFYKSIIASNLEAGTASDSEGRIRAYFFSKEKVISSPDKESLFLGSKETIITTFFEASRIVKEQNVTTITSENAFEAQLQGTLSPGALFKQYLVNRKVFQVFDAMEGQAEAAKQQELFFSKLENTLAKIFEDPGTRLEFVRENFEFYINLSDGRRFTFNQLSAGFSAFLEQIPS